MTASLLVASLGLLVLLLAAMTSRDRVTRRRLAALAPHAFPATRTRHGDRARPANQAPPADQAGAPARTDSVHQVGLVAEAVPGDPAAVADGVGLVTAADPAAQVGPAGEGGLMGRGGPVGRSTSPGPGRPADPRPANVDQGADEGRRAGRRPSPWRRAAEALIAAATGLAVALFLGGWWGVPVGAAVAVGTHRVLRDREPASVRAERTRATGDLPLAADLLAAALRAGAPVDLAASAVAGALGGPLGERLQRVARSLRLGGEAAESWSHLSDVDGAERLAAAAVRSSASGGALAGALTRLADDLRADRSVHAEAATRRAGVLIVLPLGLCFLPAFVLTGLVPVIVAVLGDVL